MKSRRILGGWLTIVACALALAVGCDDSGGSDGDAGAGGGTGGGAGGGTGGGAAGGAGGDAGGAGGGAGGAGGGTGGGAGGDGPRPMEPPVDERCPQARSGDYFLVAYPDRVDAYRLTLSPGSDDTPAGYSTAYECQFLALGANGITDAISMAYHEPTDQFFVLQTEDDRGAIYAFSSNGEFVGQTDVNVNLAGAGGLWPDGGDGFVAWSRRNSNFYSLNSEGRFAGTWTPPDWPSARLQNVTDVAFLNRDQVVISFSDQKPRLFQDLRAEFENEIVGPANAVTAVQTRDGVKILMTSQLGGEGNAYGVLLTGAANSRRTAPDVEAVLVEAGEIVDGIDLITLDEGIAVLDSALQGAPSVTFFLSTGTPAGMVSLQPEGRGKDTPIGIDFRRVFPDF